MSFYMQNDAVHMGNRGQLFVFIILLKLSNDQVGAILKREQE